MSVGLPSDEVAEDYKNSLEDLTLNSRYEISNLTIIAKENTEYAMAISRVLENHIRNVSIMRQRHAEKLAATAIQMMYQPSEEITNLCADPPESQASCPLCP